MEWDPIILTFKLAAVTTLILLVVAIPVSYWLSFTSSRIKPIIETMVSLPLVLPPTVLGFYLLLAFSPQSTVGSWFDRTSVQGSGCDMAGSESRQMNTPFDVPVAR